MHPKDAAGIANNVDPDQTPPLGAVWSGSALFAQTYLSEKFGSLWYLNISQVPFQESLLHWPVYGIFMMLNFIESDK